MCTGQSIATAIGLTFREYKARADLYWGWVCSKQRMRSGSLTIVPCTTQITSTCSSLLQLFCGESTKATHIQKTGSGPSFQPETFPNQRWAPRYVRQLELLLPFSSNEAIVPNQQGTSVAEKRTGALTQGRTDATLYDTLTCVLLFLLILTLPLTGSAALGGPGSPASCSQTHPPIPAPPGTGLRLLHYL